MHGKSHLFEFRHHLSFAESSERAELFSASRVFGIILCQLTEVIAFLDHGINVVDVSFNGVEICVGRLHFKQQKLHGAGFAFLYFFICILDFVVFIFDLGVRDFRLGQLVKIKHDQLAVHLVVFFQVFSFQAVRGDLGIFFDPFHQFIEGQGAAHIFFHGGKELRIFFQGGEIFLSVKAFIGLQGGILHQFLGRIVLDLGKDFLIRDFDAQFLHLFAQDDLLFHPLPGLVRKLA